jgi:uncharacterized protein (TIGR00730 family)
VDPVERTPRGFVKAYHNRGFLDSRDARMIRILAEYLEPLQRFQRCNVRETIVFFGSARARPLETVRMEYEQALADRRRLKGSISRDVRTKLGALQIEMRMARYYEEAVELSALLTHWSKSLPQPNRFVVCSGGGPGIMEAANRGATQRGGGLSVGLTISLPTEEQPNPFITPELLFEFHYFFMRKLWFIYLATALVVFPGGFGTLDELWEVLTLLQTRKVDRPLPVILYGRRFWYEVIDFDALVRWGTISRDDLRLFRFCDTPREAFDILKKQLVKYYPVPTGWGRSSKGS